MRSDNAFVKQLDDAIPLTLEDCIEMEKHSFCYWSVIGELIWPMVTACPDIAFAVIKLSQFAAAPAQIHFNAAKHICQYLIDKKEYGIIYMRKNDIPTLPSLS